jgi:hypothetical protein
MSASPSIWECILDLHLNVTQSRDKYHCSVPYQADDSEVEEPRWGLIAQRPQGQFASSSTFVEHAAILYWYVAS